VSHWNYRIVKNKAGWHSIHEAYYDEDGKLNGYTVNSIAVDGETVESISRVLEMMKEALDKPIIDEGEVDG